MIAASALGGGEAKMYEWHDPILEKYALRLLALPYVWGGDDPLVGFDCSGYVIELMRSVGQLPMAGDWRAQGLYDHFEAGARADALGVPRFGALVFYGRSVTEITHVAFALDTDRIAEFGGGGSRVKSAAEAAVANAYGRIRPVDHRGDRVAILRPKYRGTLTASN